jgi:hypothetical protein
VADKRFDHRLVVGTYGDPRWSVGVTTSQVRSGIQRYTTSDNETQRVPAGRSGTQNFLERIFRRSGHSAPPASSGRRCRDPRAECLP